MLLSSVRIKYEDPRGSKWNPKWDVHHLKNETPVPTKWSIVGDFNKLQLPVKGGRKRGTPLSPQAEQEYLSYVQSDKVLKCLNICCLPGLRDRWALSVRVDLMPTSISSAVVRVGGSASSGHLLTRVTAANTQRVSWRPRACWRYRCWLSLIRVFKLLSDCLSKLWLTVTRVFLQSFLWAIISSTLIIHHTHTQTHTHARAHFLLLPPF